MLMHQANKRINEYCAKALGLREEQVPHNIHKYGNTTAATIPLLWDECARDGRLQPGDLVLMVGVRGRHDLGRVARPRVGRPRERERPRGPRGPASAGAGAARERGRPSGRASAEAQRAGRGAGGGVDWQRGQ